MITSGIKSRVSAWLAGAVLSLVTLSVAQAAQQSFNSPDAAVAALMAALNGNDKTALRAIFGPDGTRLLSSGDAIADANNRAAFSKAYAESHQIVVAGDALATLVVGTDAWSMPIPLVRSGQRWQFDTLKGENEIIERRIGRNELEAMEVCRAIADAQREYAAEHLDDGVPVYATRLTSHTGLHDGLFWPVKPGETPSPLGALLAAAADEGYPSHGALRHTPYRGYYFRILKSQGPDAPGGVQDYVIRGKMIGGFAVLAYPARYGASGVTSFLLDHDGKMFERDLGQDSLHAAASIQSFNPNSDWHPADAQPAAALVAP